MASANDTFTRGDENPLANGTWTTASTFQAVRLVTNKVQGNSADSVSYWSAETWTADLYSEVEYRGAAPDSGPALRIQTGAKTCYMYNGASLGGAVCKFIAGAFSTVATRTATWANTDLCRLEAVGSTLRAYRNGVQIGADITDTNITAAGGGPGIFCYGAHTCDNFLAADIGAAPATPFPPFRHRIQTIGG